MRVARTAISLILLLVALPVAQAQTLDLAPDCPENPTACTSYATASVQVGPVLVTAVVSFEGDSGELEAEATARAGDAGNFTFRVRDATGNESAPEVNVTLEVLESNATLTWEGPTNVTLAFDPADVEQRHAIGFALSASQPEGVYGIPFRVTVGDESAEATVLMRVVAEDEEERNESPGPAAPLVAAAVAAALALRGARRRS